MRFIVSDEFADFVDSEIAKGPDEDVRKAVEFIQNPRAET
jgi:hypothetical protein